MAEVKLGFKLGLWVRAGHESQSAHGECHTGPASGQRQRIPRTAEPWHLLMPGTQKGCMNPSDLPHGDPGSPAPPLTSLLVLGMLRDPIVALPLKCSLPGHGYPQVWRHRASALPIIRAGGQQCSAHSQCTCPPPPPVPGAPWWRGVGTNRLPGSPRHYAFTLRTQHEPEWGNPETWSNTCCITNARGREGRPQTYLWSVDGPQR
mmetsp:Transcript_43822/g.71186  ORF Transcript_43822/g.71186 Transcript_43822/m.71186 type:complete len:205 (-) Transcript_43822:437-1051(-)